MNEKETMTDQEKGNAIGEDKSGRKCCKTVKFNVGGTRYEVSRSLIEESYPDTVLARMISDTWQSDPDATIFIERDGDRFRFVLDYMREQQVHLPPTVSKVSVLNELNYFGIEADPDEVNDGCGLAEIAAQMAKCEERYQEELKKTRAERIYFQIAHQFFLEYSKTGQLPETPINQFRFTSETHEEVKKAFGYHDGGTLNMELFNGVLARRGLVYENHRLLNTGYVGITVRLLDATPEAAGKK